MWFNLIFYLFTFQLVHLIHLVQSTGQDLDNNEYLIVANDSHIFKINEIERTFTLITQIAEYDEVSEIDYSFDYKLLFWLNRFDLSIHVLNINTGRKINLLPKQQVPTDDFAIDWVTNKIYRLVINPNRIEVSDFNGANNSLILNLSRQTPTCIALAPLSGLLFWNDATTESIYSVSMDGNEETIKQIINHTKALSITVDHNLKKIYWNDEDYSIRSIDFNGQHLRQILQSTYTPNVVFHNYNSNIYYSSLIDRSIVSLNVNGGKKKQLFRTNETVLLNYFSHHNQPDYSNQCLINNGECSNLCLLSSQSPFYTCTCPTGFPLSSNNRTCKKFSDEFLLVAFPYHISFISLNTKDFLPQSTKILNQEKIHAVDFDPIEQRVYWIDKNKIKSAFLNGTDQQIITDCELEYERLRIDIVNRNIYLVKNSVTISRNPKRNLNTHSSNSSIEVVSLNGKFKKTLINDYIDLPRAIAVDERNKFFYWSDWGKPAKIERVSFDLKVREQIIQIDIIWPNAIVIDKELDRLYWCDARLEKIEYSDLDGSNRHVLVKLDFPILDLTLIDDYIYWIDSTKDRVGRVQKRTGQYEYITDRNQKLDKIFALSSVSTSISIKLNDQNQISQKSCSQLSLSLDLCACSNGYALQDDNITCELGYDTCLLDNGGCEQNCNQLIGNFYQCSCNASSYLEMDKKSCAFLDSICNGTPKYCSHECVSIDNTPNCLCPHGMFLDKDGKNCKYHNNMNNGGSWVSTEIPEKKLDNLILIIGGLSTCLISSILIIRYMLIKKKPKKFQHSKEKILSNNSDHQMDFNHHSLSNAENSILFDRSLGVGASVLDDNRSLMDSCADNMSSVSKWQYRPMSQNNDDNLLINQNQLNLDESNSDKNSIDRSFNENSSIDNLDDCLSNDDLMTNVNIHVPPPSPSFSTNFIVKDEYHQILNKIHYDDQPNQIEEKPSPVRPKIKLNPKEEHIINLTNSNASCNTSISDLSYFNPPNSLNSSISNLNNFNSKKYDA